MAILERCSLIGTRGNLRNNGLGAVSSTATDHALDLRDFSSAACSASTTCQRFCLARFVVQELVALSLAGR
jgi:hypothetical protein